MSSPKILLVEDSSEDVLFFKKAFVQAGLVCSLEVATDGQEAMERLAAGVGTDPSHVVLDLKLPRFSGLEVLSWIRSHPVLDRMPVIILTSSQLPTDIQKATALGIDAFLVKPVSFRDLVGVVHGIADRWKIPTGVVQKPSL
jgi:CheY-like chemotaxis protein